MLSNSFVDVRSSGDLEEILVRSFFSSTVFLAVVFLSGFSSLGQPDIVALGELLIDFTEAGHSQDGRKLFEQYPGGAPANLLTVASHFGYRTSFIGKVGNDMHGKFLKKTLQKEGINTDAIVEEMCIRDSI